MATNNNEDIVLFAAEPSLELGTLAEIKYKLHAYDASACKMGISTNWAKVEIPTKKCKNSRCNRKELTGPYNKIQAGDNAKILGNLIDANNTTNKTFNNRLNKAQASWNVVKNIRREESVNNNLDISVYNALIGIILTYSLRIVNINNKHQKLYNRDIRNV